ncbi:MAG TPA: hypothetical protein DDY13_08125 [Cytophagales bacterium]|mgnify:CR=1 FL=1|nr:hypothetical protein [Cytophagales bacterium]
MVHGSWLMVRGSWLMVYGSWFRHLRVTLKEFRMSGSGQVYCRFIKTLICPGTNRDTYSFTPMQVLSPATLQWIMNAKVQGVSKNV